MSNSVMGARRILSRGGQIILFLFKINVTKAGSATYMSHSSKNMHMKVIHTKLDVTLKLNTFGNS